MRILGLAGAYPLALVILGSLASVAAATTRLAGSPPPNIPEFLATCDFVCIGTVLDIRPVSRVFQGPCGHSPDPTQCIEVRIRPSEVLVGLAPDSIVIVYSLMSVTTSRADLPATFLCWSYRSCGDGWNLHAGFAKVEHDGTLTPDGAASEAFHHDASRTASRLDLLRVAVAKAAEGRGASIFDGRVGAVWVRVAEVEVLGTQRVLHVDPLGMAVGREGRAPSWIRIQAILPCVPVPATGDTLLVPTDSSAGGDSLVVPGCLNAVLVNHGFIPGLGVTVDRVDDVLALDRGRIHLRPLGRLR